MARDFSPIHFFRRVPNALLGPYFHERHGVLQDIAFDDLKESKKNAEKIFQDFAALPDGTQAKIEAECRDIDSMAHQAGVTALIEEATDFHQDATFQDAINQMQGFHGMVMWAFLEHPNYWAGATSILYAENITGSSWKKRNDLPHLPPSVDPEDAEELANGLRGCKTISCRK